MNPRVEINPGPCSPHGEGPGEITADGCAVDVYLALPCRGELELLAAHLPAGCSVLELGCGAGRLTRALIERGHGVAAVDNSAEMLRHVPDAAERILCDIERLDLGRTFDVVLLASNLVNTPDATLRAAQLTACRRHLKPSGELLFQRLDPAWLSAVTPGPFPPIGDVGIAIERADRHGELVDMSIRYTIGQRQWRQHFAVRALGDEEVRDALRESGFDSVAWIDARWGAAR